MATNIIPGTWYTYRCKKKMQKVWFRLHHLDAGNPRIFQERRKLSVLPSLPGQSHVCHHRRSRHAHRRSRG